MIYMSFDQAQLTRVIGALTKIVSGATYISREVLPKQLAQAFKVHIITSIGSQKYMAGYQPYTTQRYIDWKAAHGINPDMYWYLMGDLVRNLTIFRKSNGWFSGIPEDVLDAGWKSWSTKKGARSNQPTSIAAYGWIMEEGGDYSSEHGGRHPARPLFGPAFEDFAWNMAPLELDKVIPQLEARWS